MFSVFVVPLEFARSTGVFWFVSGSFFLLLLVLSLDFVWSRKG